MRRSFISLLVGAVGLVLLLASPAAASPPTAHVHGGGTGTFGSDLDGDGDIDGSQFAFTAAIGNAGASGRFMCLMAGRSDILGLPIMSVTGAITSGSGTTSDATFGGVATVNLGNGTMFPNVPYSVTVHQGGPGTGTLKLTVIGAFEGVPGDTVIGNGNYDLPPETVRTGGIVVGS